LEFLSEYGMFLLKAATLVTAVLLVIAAAVAAGQRAHRHERGRIEIRSLNDEFEAMKDAMEEVVLQPEEARQLHKDRRKREKAERKAAKKQLRQHRRKAHQQGNESEEGQKKRLYVLDFDGDIRAHAVNNLREEISAVLAAARSGDEVVLRLESGGGMVHAYGLAASQLQRVKEKGLLLTVCVDKVAASGGYMMACIGDRIRSAPFAILGSVGVIAQIPNFHRLLKKHDVDYEIFTAGEYKRTLTILGENTERGRRKFNEDLEETHELFKQFVAEHRPGVDIGQIATGEVWYGSRALDVKLVDELGTSDQYLQDACAQADVFHVRWEQKKSLQERLALGMEHSLGRLLDRGLARLLETRYPH